MAFELARPSRKTVAFAVQSMLLMNEMTSAYRGTRTAGLAERVDRQVDRLTRMGGLEAENAVQVARPTAAVPGHCIQKKGGLLPDQRFQQRQGFLRGIPRNAFSESTRPRPLTERWPAARQRCRFRRRRPPAGSIPARVPESSRRSLRRAGRPVNNEDTVNT